MNENNTQYDYDLFVIGAGSGGVRASRMAASYGKKVAVAEDLHMGGTCVNVGCVPKKLFVYASHFKEEFESAAGYGWTVPEGQFNWATLRDNKTKEIQRLNGIYDGMLGNAGVEVIHGRGTIVDAHTVAVGDKHYTTENILVAVGGWPFAPDIPGSEHILSSNDMFYLDDLPEDAIVVGGGYIAVEFAGILAGLGLNVTQIYRGELFLRGFDGDVRRFLAQEMEKKDIALKFNTNIASIEKLENGRFIATFDDGSTQETGMIMYATGRLPKTKNLGLEGVGVDMDDRGAIKVDDKFQSSVPSIYALGDVIDRVALTPVAIKEAMVLTNNLYRDMDDRMDYADIPTAVFSQPTIGTVGYGEEDAREKFGEITVYKSEFRPMKNTLGGSSERAFMKLIVETKTDRVIGVHMVGPEAGEIIQGMGIAIKAGATKAQFDATVGIHPTSAEEFVTMRTPVS